MLFFNVARDGARMTAGYDAQVWLESVSPDAAKVVTVFGSVEGKPTDGKDQKADCSGRIASVSSNGQLLIVEPTTTKSGEPVRAEIRLTDATRESYHGVAADGAEPAVGYQVQVWLAEGSPNTAARARFVRSDPRPSVEARIVAVRLKDVAEAGQVVCTGATHKLLQVHFECASLGSRKLKGVAQPAELFRLEAIAPARNPIETAVPAGLTTLTGRDHEINLLKDRWEQAQEGMGQVILLSGEPGLGKSRLVYTLKQHVLGQMAEGEADAPVIEWRCSPHYQNTGLFPAIDFYERALSFNREQPPQARFERLVQRLEQYDGPRLIRPLADMGEVSAARY